LDAADATHDRAILFCQEVDPGAEVIGMPHGRDDAKS
jgi:hypothetical protein